MSTQAQPAMLRMGDLMWCEERQRLIGAWSDAISRLEAHAVIMTQRVGSGERQSNAFQAAQQQAEQAKVNVDNARLDLDKHMADHGCSLPNPSKDQDRC